MILSTPIRNCENLYVHLSTLNCALHSCIPCLYKICVSTPASCPKNRRPRECLRLLNATTEQKHNAEGRTFVTPLTSTFSAKSHVKFLIIGDGDLSFSASVSKLLPSSNYKLFATSYLSYDQLKKTYKNFVQNLKTLSSSSISEILYKVDATNLPPTLDSHQFDIIWWNFPCVEAAEGKDGQSEELSQNIDLLKRFFLTAKATLRENGEVRVVHKTLEPFSWWKIEELGKESGLECIHKSVFDLSLFPGYSPRKVSENGKKKGFPVTDAVMYVFSLGTKEILSREDTAEDTFFNTRMLESKQEWFKITPTRIGQLFEILKLQNPSKRKRKRK
eukprot:snap_masked-scaffold_18-processed-gene-1.22-mRNA-1 protein AED:1.00 eAED:1.00 QI:0/-1/0/0/-1/1/1/0/331